MSTLLVDELYPGVVFPQPFRIENDINIAHIRPWIYKEGTLQDGDLRVQVYQGATLLAEATASHTDINAAITETYGHGFLRLDFDALSLRIDEGNTEEEYELRFEMINHTLDTNNFLGIVRRWEAKTYPTYGDGVVDGEAPNDSVEPAGLELFEYTYL